MSLTVAELRQRIATLLGSIEGWRESPFPFELFPLDPGRFAHHAFAVGVGRSSFTTPVESSRHRGGGSRLETGGLGDTVVAVRWLARLRADASVADLDIALADELELVEALVGITTTDMHLALETLDRRTVGDGTWLLGELGLTAQHRYPLQRA